MHYDFDNSQDYLDGISGKISALLGTAIAQTGRAGLAVSGGRSPVPLFERLSREDLHWEKVDVTLVDERFVSPEHPDSNAYLVRKHLLKNRAQRARFTGLVSHPDDLALCLREANRQNAPITLAVLGMGDDGHTASLFPDAPQLEQALDLHTSQRYIHISPPDAPYERISMTLAAILKAEQLIVTISGTHKRRIVDQAAQGPTPQLPISYVITQTGAPLDVYWHP